MTPRIAIVGGGIGGMACALALRRLGYSDVRIYEQTAALSEVGAGIGLWPGALRTLDQLELADWFWRLRVCPFSWAETCTPDGRTLTGFDVSAMTAAAPGFVVRRQDLHRALHEQLASDQLTLSATATHVSDQGRSATITFADGAHVEADIVIAADGIDSVVRASLFGVEPPRYSGETCYRALVDFEVADTGVLREVQGPGQRTAVHAISPTQAYWWAARRSAEGGSESPEQRKSILQSLYAGWRGGFPEALAATPAGSILKNDLYDRPPLKRWSTRRVTLLGDAAHPTTPNLGLGGCMAIEDGLVLARALHENSDNPELAFAQYEHERRARTTRVVRMSHWFGRLGSMTNPIAVRARQLSMRLTPASVMARTFAVPVTFDPGPLRRPGGPPR